MNVGYAKIAIDQYLALTSITAGPSSVINISTMSVGYSTYASSGSRHQQTLSRYASVNLVYDKKP